MKRDLNVTYKTAWYLCHRIREAMREGGVSGGTVEMDETYIAVATTSAATLTTT